MERVAETILRSKRVIVLAAIVLIASNGLFAQKSVPKWRLFNENNIEAEVVYAEPTSVAIVSYDNYLKTLDFIVENKIELEDWMTNTEAWENNLIKNGEAVIEEELALEEWMLDFSLLDEIKDSDLALEEWMTPSECWK